MRKLVVAAVVVVLVIVAAYLLWPRPGRAPKPLEKLLESVRKGERIDLRVAGKTAGRIEKKYTCDDGDVSPPVPWGDLPKGTISLALICYDIDAPRGIFVHWVIFNIPPTLGSLPGGVPKRGVVEGLGIQGRNDFGSLGYGGPCPPHGEHRYVFLLLALDVKLDLKEGLDVARVLSEAEGHVLGYGEVVLTYRRV